MSLLEPHPVGVPFAEPTEFSRPYWAGTAVAQLRYQGCMDCDRAIFDPAPICPSCNSSNLEWRTSAGQGAIYSWSVVWRTASPDFRSPYAVAIIDLDEGYQMLANVIGCEPSEVRVGLRVAVEFHRISDDLWLPYFRPIQKEK